LSTAAQGIDRLPDRNVVDVGSDRGYNAGELVRRRRREPIDRPSELVSRDRCGVHADEGLARPVPGRLDLVDDELLEAAGRV
jgi:hypothetical protein